MSMKAPGTPGGPSDFELAALLTAATVFLALVGALVIGAIAYFSWVHGPIFLASAILVCVAIATIHKFWMVKLETDDE